MAIKIFVGNLPFSMKDNEMADLFSEVGTVQSATIITDKFSGRSRGFGFVEMSSDDEAREAIEKLNGREINGRAIVVNEARPMEERKPGGGNGGFRRERRDFHGRGDR